MFIAIALTKNSSDCIFFNALVVVETSSNLSLHDTVKELHPTPRRLRPRGIHDALPCRKIFSTALLRGGTQCYASRYNVM